MAQQEIITVFIVVCVCVRWDFKLNTCVGFVAFECVWLLLLLFLVLFYFSYIFLLSWYMGACVHWYITHTLARTRYILIQKLSDLLFFSFFVYNEVYLLHSLFSVSVWQIFIMYIFIITEETVSRAVPCVSVYLFQVSALCVCVMVIEP